jgi:hypothetical protein
MNKLKGVLPVILLYVGAGLGTAAAPAAQEKPMADLSFGRPQTPQEITSTLAALKKGLTNVQERQSQLFTIPKGGCADVRFTTDTRHQHETNMTANQRYGAKKVHFNNYYDSRGYPNRWPGAPEHELSRRIYGDPNAAEVYELSAGHKNQPPDTGKDWIPSRLKRAGAPDVAQQRFLVGGRTDADGYIDVHINDEPATCKTGGYLPPKPPKH